MKRLIRLCLFLLVISMSAFSQPNAKYLQSSSNGRYLQWSDGTPFFITACTAWTLTYDYSAQEIKEYLDNRCANKFNVIQVSAVFDEVDISMHNRAFKNNNLVEPIEPYWLHVDSVAQEITSRGLVVMINPIWKRKLFRIIQSNGVEKCYTFAKWFANRYKNNPRVIYFIGGDDVPEPVRDELDAMGKGIQEVYNNKAIIAFHGIADMSSRDIYPNAKWLTLNWTYSYSPTYRKKFPYSLNYETWKKLPPMPTQLGEAYYDFGTVKTPRENGIAGRWANRTALRRQLWWTVLSGNMGYAYGAEGIWYKNRDGQTWQMCVNYGSSKDVTRMKTFLDKLKWWKMQPDIDHTFLVDGYGTYLTYDYALATVSEDKSFAVVYTPVKHTFNLNLPKGKKSIQKMRWFDPSNGMYNDVKKGEYKIEDHKLIITSPDLNSDKQNDWILLVNFKKYYK
jgi:hypothetical protein